MILDLLRVTPADPGAAPVSALVEVGELFGFSGNTVRVAVSRLVRVGLLESDERGWYRLSSRTDPVNRHVSSWREGEARIRRPWNGAWLAIALSKASRREERKSSKRALDMLGFRAGFDLLWVRPDNLDESHEQTAARLEELGYEASAELLVVASVPEATDLRWRHGLWPTQRLLSSYRVLRRDLANSMKRLRSMPSEQGLVETFLLGGAAMRALALDPLLPSEILPTDLRGKLTEDLLAYEEIGWELWQRRIDQLPLERAPHLTFAFAGSG